MTLAEAKETLRRSGFHYIIVEHDSDKCWYWGPRKCGGEIYPFALEKGKTRYTFCENHWNQYLHQIRHNPAREPIEVITKSMIERSRRVF